MIRKKYRKIVGFIFMSIFMVVLCFAKDQNASAQEKNQSLRVHFIDVGAGDAALIQYGEGQKAQYALIDAGPVYYQRTNKQNVNTSDRVHQYLNERKITHLEFVLLTHPHQDHIGGMIKILDDPTIKIDKIYGNDINQKLLQSSDDLKQQTAQTAIMKEYRDPEGVYKSVIEKMEQRIAQGKMQYIIPKPGQKVKIGKAVLTFYGPIQNNYAYARRGDLNYRQVNKCSIVSKLSYGKNTFLMTGDAQKDTIEVLLKKGYNLQAQVLKVPHHGMQDIIKNGNNLRSDHTLLFQHVKAKVAIISNGYDNIYKAPHKKVLQDLSASDIYDTGSRGTIVVTADGKKISIKVQKGKGPRQKRVKKGPQNAKIKSNLRGIKTLELKKKDKTIIKSKKPIKFKFAASYGVSEKKTVQFKIVPINKKATKYQWLTGENIKYSKENQKARIYVRFINCAGYQTTRKSNIFIIEKKKDKKKQKERKENDKTDCDRYRWNIS